MERCIRFGFFRTLCACQLRRKLCCREGTLSPTWRGVPSRGEQLLLLEGDRGLGRDRDVLPLVAGALVERAIEREGLGLARRDRADRGDRQALVGNQRRDAADAHEELARVRCRRVDSDDGRVADRFGALAQRQAELGDGRDVTGVGDVDLLVLDVSARRQLVEVEVERADRRLVVGQAERQGCRVGVDGTTAGRREVRRRGHRGQEQRGRQGDGADATDVADVLLGAGGEGHGVPYLWLVPRSVDRVLDEHVLQRCNAQNEEYLKIGCMSTLILPFV